MILSIYLLKIIIIYFLLYLIIKRSVYKNITLHFDVICDIIDTSQRKSGYMRKININLKAIITALVGVIFMAFGIYRGEMATVFAKAVRICLECIGIG